MMVLGGPKRKMVLERDIFQACFPGGAGYKMDLGHTVDIWYFEKFEGFYKRYLLDFLVLSVQASSWKGFSKMRKWYAWHISILIKSLSISFKVFQNSPNRS